MPDDGTPPPARVPTATSPPPPPSPPPPMIALVTGGGGFLGRAIVDQLLARGDRVRTLSRQHYPELDAMGVRTFQGDICDMEIVDRACDGCDTIFHVAAKAGVWGTYEEYHRPNVVGTETCLAASQKNGIRRFVHTSSPSVVFDGHDMRGIDESVPYPKKHRSHYSATKALAEQKVLAANRETLRTIALRPHLIWGPRDNHIVPRLIAQAQSGKLRIIGDGKNIVDTTYIDNAANAHLRAADALTHNPIAAGRPYFISNGEPVALWDIINGILQAANLEPITQHIPRRMAIAAGTATETFHKIFRPTIEPRLTRFVAEELASHHWFNIEAAKRELGYTPTVTLAEGLVRLERWLTR